MVTTAQVLQQSGQIVLASGNPGKIREFSELLAPLGLRVIPQGEMGVTECSEDGLSFIENAILKARHAADITGLPALADDSGIEVDALQGRPGIYSARYAGAKASDAENNQRLLHELAGIPTHLRTARYRCVIALLRHAADPSPIIAEGSWEGRILETPSGSGGFGYDPLFFSPETDCTVAALAPARKNALSHRGQALRLLLQKLHLTSLTSPADL